MTNPNASLDAIVAQKIGELTILNAKQAVLIEQLKREIIMRDQKIATLEAKEPELPLACKEKANGAIAH